MSIQNTLRLFSIIYVLIDRLQLYTIHRMSELLYFNNCITLLMNCFVKNIFITSVTGGLLLL